MKPFILMILLMFGGWSFSFSQDANEISSGYLKMKDAMIPGNVSAAASHASELIKSIEEVKEFEGRDKAIGALKKISNSNEIEKQRKELAVISPLIWKYLVRNDHSGETLYYQYCPMKKSNWISKEQAIRNPYYGNKMLDCGNVSDSLK